jgi:hypothetical protein
VFGDGFVDVDAMEGVDDVDDLYGLECGLIGEFEFL